MLCLETFNAKRRCKPDGDQLKSLIADVFFVADEERIAVRSSHPGYLGSTALLQLNLYNLSFADFTEKISIKFALFCILHYFNKTL